MLEGNAVFSLYIHPSLYVTIIKAYEELSQKSRCKTSFFSHSPQPPTEDDDETDIECETLLNEFTRRNKYIDRLHINSNYTTLAQLWLIKQTLKLRKWRFVTDEDQTIMKAIYRVFNFIQQNSPTSISGEMNAYWYSISGGSNPD
ncbi:hypothetical protein J22TS1_22960 [Siminovitchia terrae]|nr:hypothetical protein J22TS1_22960 [Siminovitchia terrae]